MRDWLALAAIVLFASGCQPAPGEVQQSGEPAATATEFAAPQRGAESAPTAIPTRTPGIAYPDPLMTPGDVLPATLAEICTPGYSSAVRDVSTATKNRVYLAYGITVNRLPGEFEMDHLVPLELGGSNDPKNLWPEPAAPAPGFHQKDQLENRLHDLACAGDIAFDQAQRLIASDWYAAYVTFVLNGEAQP
jgi:hypothetical protein